MKALKYFHDNFELRKKEEDKLSIDSINSELELDEEEQDLLNSKSNLYTIKKKLKKNLKNLKIKEKNKEKEKKEEKNLIEKDEEDEKILKLEYQKNY